MYLSPGLRGGHRHAGSALLTVAAVSGLYTSGTGRWGFDFGMFKQFYTMYISPGLRGGHALASGSLFTVAVILVCI